MELTGDQEKLMLETWNKTPSNPPSLKALTQAIFGGEFDGRSEQGLAIKKCLAKHSLKARAAQEYTPKTDGIELSDAHKQYIINNASTMNALEMARIIFSNNNLSNLNAETRAVNEFMKTLDTKVIYSKDNVKDVPADKYKAPETLDAVLKRVNRYISFVQSKDKLTPSQKKNLGTLIGYLNTFRFTTQMNSYDSQESRDLCEDSFIRGTYDKPDLTQEEVDQYIELANQVVHSFKTQKRKEALERQLETITESDDDEKKKYSMGLVEAIGKASAEYHQCIDRQKKLLDNLTQKRSSRLDKQISETASLINLVQMWREEESRRELLKMAELEQKSVSDEVERLSSVAEIKARILGVSKNQIKHG